MGKAKAIYSPLSVAATAKQLLSHGLMKSEPVWYQPVLNTPPMTDFARKPAQEHQRRGPHKTTDIREIQQIQIGLIPELRKKFYKQHPWELARPRILVEEDGADYSRQDWSKIEQVGKPLDGESVVQRTLYLMNELKSPVERFQEIYGFDESQARGRPCDKLPRYGNIPEVIAPEAAVEDYRRIMRALDSLSRHRKTLEDGLKILRQRRRALNRVATSLNEKQQNQKATSEDELKEQRAQVTALRNTDLAIDNRLKRLKYIVPRIPALEKRAFKMCRLSPEEAYLQACSEFYMLRQQEEVETRIAIEQARCFRRELGPTVNEKELQKEQKVLIQWKAKAERQQTLLIDARRAQKNGPTADKAATTKDEENVEEELEKETILEETNTK